MSMTLEEAIKHAEAAAIENEKEAKRKREHGGWFYDNEAHACSICAEQHRQLADWLRELQKRRSFDAAREQSSSKKINAFCSNCRNEAPEGLSYNKFWDMVNKASKLCDELKTWVSEDYAWDEAIALIDEDLRPLLIRLQLEDAKK